MEWSQLENSIKNKEADIACSGLTIRSSRMEWADFTLPTMNSGLGIMILKEEKSRGFFFNLIYKMKIMVNALIIPVMFFCGFIVIFAIVLWKLEKDDDPDNDANSISDKFFPGVFEAIYFCVVTCSTVGYGDFTPKRGISKIVVGVLIFAGIMAFCNFTALLSADYTTDITEDITGPSDLKGRIVLTQKGTTSVSYIKKIGAKTKTVDDIDTACDYLLLKRGDAVVFDYPVLLNYVKNNPEKVKMVGGMFDKQYYGFMLQKRSLLKRDIDLSILKIYEDGTYQTLYNKWF